MLPDTPPMLRWTIVLAVLTALVVAVVTIASLPPTPSQPDVRSGGSTVTTGAPLAADDRAMLVALRQHGLWAAPVAQQAQQMATSPAVRALGSAVAVDLDALSERVRAVAGRLGVALPSQPTGQQQVWVSQISSRSGPDYDETVLSRLRTACSATAALVNRVRASTRNEEIRALANQAASVVARHLAYLDRFQPRTSAPAVTAVSHADASVAAVSPPASGAPAAVLAAAVLLILAGGLTLTRLALTGPVRAARRRW